MEEGCVKGEGIINCKANTCRHSLILRFFQTGLGMNRTHMLFKSGNNYIKLCFVKKHHKEPNPRSCF